MYTVVWGERRAWEWSLRHRGALHLQTPQVCGHRFLTASALPPSHSPFLPQLAHELSRSLQ